MYNDIISRMDSLGAAWKSQFENKPDFSFCWTVDANSVLCLNGVGICPVESLCPTGECYDVEVLTLPLKDGCVDVVIDWPYEGPVRISEIVTHKVLEDESDRE